jgi:citrate lyase beta subunit
MTTVARRAGLWVPASEPAKIAKVRALEVGKVVVALPRRVAIVQETFTPTEVKARYVREILAAMDKAASAGRDATQFQGRMLDEAMGQQARGVLSRTVTR